MRQIVAATGTSPGMKRDHNEDRHLVQAPGSLELADSKGWLMIVADGMGGHASGEVAARLVVDTVAHVFLKSHEADPSDSLVQALTQAHAVVRQRAESDANTKGMGATCVIAALRNDQITTAHAGDCRAYLLRAGELIRLTDDHTFVAQLVREKVIDEDQAMTHPRRNFVTRAVGQSGELTPDINRHDLQAGDVVLLCSDGLSGVVPDDQLKLLLQDHRNLEETVRRLIGAANEAGGPDNVTVVLAQVI